MYRTRLFTALTRLAVEASIAGKLRLAVRFFHSLLTILVLAILVPSSTRAQEDALRPKVTAAMKRAAGYYYNQVASHGGYVYHYSLDLSQRWGEGVATPEQIWVQPPGTPTVGLAYLEAYEATGDEFYLQAATDAARSLAYGQLKSGGWTNCVDFDPQGTRLAEYRNGRGRGKNNSSLDDGQTQSALRLMIRADKALSFQDAAIHESATIGLAALLAAQFPNGGFPQVWTGPVEEHPVKQANYPEHDWRTEGRIKNYWDMYTLNDNVTGYVAETLIDAHAVYEDQRYLEALRKLGDFLLLAQMPEPQPAWAQQYNYEMQPIWARRFEPPGISGDETQEVIDTLLKIYAVTGDRKYLEPIPRALAWLERSLLPDRRLARYYELETNRPLYMSRRGDTYTLTYDDSNLPSHYGWKTESRIESLRAQNTRASATRGAPVATRNEAPSRQQVQQILKDLDDQGRWVSTYQGEALVGQAKMPLGTPYLASAVFSQNLVTLSQFLSAADKSAEASRSRTWSDRTGQFSVEAELVTISGEQVTLRRHDGKVVSVPINRLSAEDQRFLARYRHRPARRR